MTAEKPVVLVVDNAPDNIALASSLLKSEYKVKVATNGAKALQIVEQAAPDLILLDVMMPGMDGPATIAALRQTELFRETPVIFMTAKVQAHEVAYYKTLGALGVISKPFDPMSLAGEIRSLWETQGETGENRK